MWGKLPRWKNIKNKYKKFLKNSIQEKYTIDRIYINGTGGKPATPSSSNALQKTELNTESQEVLGRRMTDFNSEFDNDREVTQAKVDTNGQGDIIVANSESSPVTHECNLRLVTI